MNCVFFSSSNSETETLAQTTEQDFKHIELSKLNAAQIGEMEHVLCAEKIELSKFCENISNKPLDQDYDILSTYKTILCLYANMRQYNRLMEGNCIDSGDLDIIATVRRELKRSKAVKMAQHVHDLYCKNTSVVTSGEQKGNGVTETQKTSSVACNKCTDADYAADNETPKQASVGDKDHIQDTSVDSGICDKENNAVNSNGANKPQKRSQELSEQVGYVEYHFPFK